MTASPNVLIWDPIRDIEWSYRREADLLRADGVELVIPATDTASPEQLEAADVVIVSDPFPAELLDGLKRCVGIICYSVGMNAVDAGAAAAAGIPVTNVAGYCTDEVADHALALLLALQRHLFPFLVAAQLGDWDVYHGPHFTGIRRLRGQTVGIVGLGRIGSQVAVRCMAFGMRVIAYDPYVETPGAAGVTMVSLDELLGSSDTVIVCGALTATSRGLLDGERIARMRPGALLVNVARGGLVDEAALAAAIRSGAIGGAALDVRAQEPPADDPDPLRGLPTVLLTQHMAATSQEARDDLHVFAARRAVELLTAAGRLPTTLA